jgi:hypothetical protein
MHGAGLFAQQRIKREFGRETVHEAELDGAIRLIDRPTGGLLPFG